MPFDRAAWQDFFERETSRQRDSKKSQLNDEIITAIDNKLERLQNFQKKNEIRVERKLEELRSPSTPPIPDIYSTFQQSTEAVPDGSSNERKSSAPAPRYSLYYFSSTRSFDPRKQPLLQTDIR